MTNQGFRKSLKRLKIAEEVVDEAKNSFVKKFPKGGKSRILRRQNGCSASAEMMSAFVAQSVARNDHVTAALCHPPMV